LYAFMIDIASPNQASCLNPSNINSVVLQG